MNEKFNIIYDDKMRNALLDFYNKVGLNTSQQKYLNTYLSKYENVKLDTLNWETICDITLSIDSSFLSTYFGAYNLNFFVYLVENNLYKDSGISSDVILNIPNLPIKKSYRTMIFDKNINLGNLIICKGIDRKNDYKEYHIMIDTKLDNPFLVELLDGFYKCGLFSNSRDYNDYNFARKFYKSYDKFSSFGDISDFNFEVFEKQFNFYKEKKTELSSLIKFYIYLHSKYEYIFKTNDPVDMFWMTRHPNFTNQFKDGFRLVDLNPIEPYPTNDRWMLRPNGHENFTTRLNETSYLTVDFTRVKYAEYRPFLKDFFWTSTTTLLVTRGYFYYIVEFLNFIYEHKTLNIKKCIDYNKITSSEIYSYIGYISNKYGLKTYNDKAKAVKNFLQKKYLNVEPAVFDFLVHAGNTTPPGGKSIPEDEVKKLDEHLLKLSYDNDTNYIYYIIFKLALHTNFRISYLLSITTDSIKEAMKKGQYYILAVTKTSDKEKVKEHISKYDHRYLEEAVRITAPLRCKAPKEYKNFVFLHDRQHNKIKGVTPINPTNFNTFLKSECKSIGLPKYTAQNIRDTSITRAIDFAVENGLSRQETEMLIRGKRSIKLKHYYDKLESKLFVEATYGVIIGNVDLKGQILETTDSSSFSKDEIMDDGCGFCKEDECRIHKDIGCPMCKYFIVTLDRIPFYIKKLEQLDIAIENETIEHEKEHLIAIKKLYAAYLSKLLDIKQKLELKQNQNIK